ncbi:hypothetical protein VTP01DRAFT_3162 [Rhizomucor pusillus]|uniref:uncharacterized protein n=1 Tax=Rhizomucor pusillus TaxID=4840 RepID=UPI00374408E6
MADSHDLKAPGLSDKLVRFGYETLQDIKDTGVIQVIQELEVSGEEAAALLEYVHGSPAPASQTAEARLQARRIGINLKSNQIKCLFDEYGGGVPTGLLTEFCGEAGSGRTQISMQLAATCIAAKDLGGNNAECLYIDTEGGLFQKRLEKMASAAGVPESDYGKIHILRTYDYVELVAVVRQLSDILATYPNIKLVVVDSISYPFRLSVRNVRLRDGLLNYIGHSLVQVAVKHGVAIVVTNHVATDRINSALTPALGHFWGTYCGVRVFLYRKQSRRYAYLYKSTLGRQERIVPFKINEHGVCDDEKDDLERITEFNAARPWTTSDSNLAVDEEEDIWDESYLTDEIISQIPSELSSGSSMMQEAQEESLGRITSSRIPQKRWREDEEVKEEEEEEEEIGPSDEDDLP